MMYDVILLLYYKMFVTITIFLHDSCHILSHYLAPSMFKIRDKKKKRKEIEKSKSKIERLYVLYKTNIIIMLL